MIKEETLNCTLITPLYSYGAYQKKIPEIRASELKGMMRYAYRIICPEYKSDRLFNNEASLFGGAAVTAGSDAASHNPRYASPLRLMIRKGADLKTDNAPLLYHKACDLYNNPAMKHYKKGSFSVKLRLNSLILPQMPYHFPKIDVSWYADIAALSLLLCGLGRRSRKGRGRVSIDEKRFETPESALAWICSVLNKTAFTTKNVRDKAYKTNHLEIIPTQNYGYASDFQFDIARLKRPVLQKIRIGEKFDPNSILKYLKTLDKQCHNLKDAQIKDAAGTPLEKYITGNDKERLASPLIISLLRIGEEIYPLYIFIKALKPSKSHRVYEFDSDCIQREIFIKNLEDSFRREAAR